MAKTAKPKPIKAWALLKRGKIAIADPAEWHCRPMLVFDRNWRAGAAAMTGEKIVRVTIQINS